MIPHQPHPHPRHTHAHTVSDHPPPASATAAANSASLEVNYLDIAHTAPTVALWLADHPRDMMPILGEAAK